MGERVNERTIHLKGCASVRKERPIVNKRAREERRNHSSVVMIKGER